MLVLHKRFMVPVLTLGLLVLAGAMAATKNDQSLHRESNNRFGRSEPLPRTPGAIRIAAYNVLNLFDQRDDPNLSGDVDDFAMATSDAHCRAIAAAILAMDADIVALSEVESLECLGWFQDTYLAEAGYEHMVSMDVGYRRGVECAVLSRYEITEAKVWPNQTLSDVRRTGTGWTPAPESTRPLAYQRSPLMVDLRIEDEYEMTLFVVHHKASRGNEYHREAEAIRTMEKVRQRVADDPARNIVVLGDFNAAPWDKSVRIYLEGGMIDTLAHRSTWKKGPDESRLYVTHESGRVLDYILLNSAAHRELVVGSAHVYGTLYDGNYDYKTDPYPEGYASDHYPVIIDLVPKDRC